MENLNKFKVTVTNKILGNSERIMTMEEIQSFNVVVLFLARQSKASDGKAFSSGMWTVEGV